MDGANTAVYTPVSALVKSPSSQCLHPAGVMPIDHPSCKVSRARKRVRIAPVSPTTVSRPNSSSRIQKNSSKPNHHGLGLKSSLVKSALIQGQSPTAAAAAAVANDAVVTSTAAAATASADTHSSAATGDELGVSGYQRDRTRLSPTISLDYGPGFDLPNMMSPGTRDHFLLYTNVAQTQSTDLNNWYGSGTGSWTSSSLNPPMFHPSAPYLPAHETSYDYSPKDYSVNYSGSTAHTYVPFLPYLDFVNPSPMAIQQPVPLGDEGPYPQWQYDAEQSCLPMPTENSPPEDWVLVDPEKSSEDVSPKTSVELLDLSSGTTTRCDEPWVDTAEVTGKAATSETHTPSQPERRSRSRLEGSNREQAANTRKIKCKPDLDNPESLRCLNCRLLNQESKKVVHKIPCLRYKITEIALFREGGLGLTQRWTGAKMKDLGPRDWTSEQTPTIKIILAKYEHPFEAEVRRFKPNSTDITWRNWVDPAGNLRRINIEPYALANISKTAAEYSAYVFENANLAVRQYTKNPTVNELVRKTYAAALDYTRKLEEYPMDYKDVNPAYFLLRYFRLWFTIRKLSVNFLFCLDGSIDETGNTTGSAFLVGNDAARLHMQGEADYDCPYRGMVSLPRMVTAQFDSLAYETILAPQRKLVLEGLSKMMQSQDQQYFFTIYLTVFMLLHEVSAISADRRRHARDNRSPHRYTLAPFVESLQEGANIILGHWHYYKRDIDPHVVTKEAKKKAEKSVWGGLGPDEAQLLAETCQAYNEIKREPVVGEGMTWEDDLYFVSHMFDDKWKPSDTFAW
ncbi:hypothetical protein F5B20DRAFT_584098 [Whalleya microplaca]|nr:hypothetical protein F5B20DRAFT_584098 [Whalleya microplaca]